MSPSNKSLFYDIAPTPLGNLRLVADHIGLREVWFDGGKHQSIPANHGQRDATKLVLVRTQIDEYFDGKRQRFDLPLHPRGTPFQLSVWRALADIPYGTTMTYAQIAERIGQPKAVRAVGAANGRNPLSIVVPCHRVIGSDGSLTGFGGGLPAKQFLLGLENRVANGDLFT